MPLAKDVAAEFRKLADSLDREPDAEVQTAWLTFYCHEKELFLATARLLPRPLKKEGGEGATRYNLVYGDYSGSIHLECSVDKSAACKLIEPAKPAVYECLPILEQHELDSVSA